MNEKLAPKKMPTVGSVMTPDPIVVDGLASVADVIETMQTNSISSLVVGKRHEGDEYGLLVVSDIARKVIGRDLSPERTNVYEVMSKPVVSVEAEMGITYAIRLLDRFELSRALVMDKGKLVGIVTMRDMVQRHVADDQA